MEDNLIKVDSSEVVTEILGEVIDNVDLQSRIEIEKSDTDQESSNLKNHNPLLVENLVKADPLSKGLVAEGNNLNGYPDQTIYNTSLCD